MTELWQLYDEDGEVLPGKGGTKDDIYAGALHGAAHVWIWRSRNGQLEVLLQRRVADKRTWPSFWDISAAGHIDLGESPEAAAIRETKEEIGLDIKEEDLAFITNRHDKLIAPSGAIENEFRWVYALRLEAETEFVLEIKEVASLTWKSLEVIKTEIKAEKPSDLYVPQGQAYFDEVFGFIENLARQQLK